MVHGLQRRYAGRIDFIYLDVSDEATAAARDRYEFVGTPQIVFVDAAGRAVGKPLFGMVAEPVLTSALDALAVSGR